MLRPVPNPPQSDRAPEPLHDELAALAEAARRGDRTALPTLLSAIVPQMIRVVRRVLGAGHPELEDVTQEAAFALVDALPRFRGEATVLHFACRTAVLTAMNVRRRERAAKRDRVRDLLDLEAIAVDGPSPETLAVQGSLVPLVRDLLDTLSEPLAEALALHVILGYTAIEVAKVTRVPVETVRSRMRLAKQALRKRILADAKLREVAEVDE